MKKQLTLAAIVSACSFGALGNQMLPLDLVGNPNEETHQFMFHGFRLADTQDNPMCLTMTLENYTNANGEGETSMVRCAREFNEYRPDLGTRDLEYTQYNEIKLKGTNVCFEAGEDEWYRATAKECSGEQSQKWRIIKSLASRNGSYTYRITTPDSDLCMGTITHKQFDHNAGPMMLKCDEQPLKDWSMDYQFLDLHNVQFESGIELYSEPNYQGEVLKLNVDQANLNDFTTIGSYKIPQWYEIRFFEEKNMQGKYYTRSVSNSDDSGIGAIDMKSVSILKTPLTNPDRPTVEPEPEVQNVVLYTEANFSGHTFTLRQDIPQMSPMFQRIKSFQVPQGWTVRFYDGANYTGRYFTRSASTNDSGALGDIDLKSFAILSGPQQRVENIQAYANTHVILYSGTNNSGTGIKLDTNTTGLGAFQSFTMPSNWTVRFFEGDNYTGRYYTVKASTAERQAVYLTGGKVKSIQILSR